MIAPPATTRSLTEIDSRIESLLNTANDLGHEIHAIFSEDANHSFEFTCSCEVHADGDIVLCDVCGTGLDLKGELATQESEQLLGDFDIFGPRYASEDEALAAGVTVLQIVADRQRALAYEAELDEQRNVRMRQEPQWFLGYIDFGPRRLR